MIQMIAFWGESIEKLQTKVNAWLKGPGKRAKLISQHFTSTATPTTRQSSGSSDHYVAIFYKKA